MGMNLVLYKGNTHLDSQLLADLPEALVAIHEAGNNADAFAIFPDDGQNHMIGFFGKNDIIHIYEPEKYNLKVQPEVVKAEIDDLLNS